MRRYGYIRVSAKDQNPERQYAALKEYEVPKKQIYIDKMSGKDFSRPAYQRMIRKLKRGDVLIIKSIDRLGRNYTEILEQWRKLTKEIGAHIKVVDMPLLDTTSGHDDLTGVFISDLVLQILAYVAETERSFIKQRQAEGIAVAKSKGVKFGHPRKELPERFMEYYVRWKRGEISVRDAARLLDMSYSTFYRRCKEVENRERGVNLCQKVDISKHSYYNENDSFTWG